MENQIEINDILTFLVDVKSSKKINNYKISDKVNLNYLEFFNSKNFMHFSEILFDHVDRIGIHASNKNSVYFSILYLLYKDFCLSDNDQQNYLVKVLKEKIKNDILNRLVKGPKELTKKKIVDILKSNKDNNLTDVYILAYYFNINIFVFSYTNKDIKAFYKEDKINIYKKNIFLNEINDVFYPLSYKHDNGRYFKYNSTVLNNVLFSNKISAYNLKNNKSFEISNSWEEILSNYLEIDVTNIVIAESNKINTLINLQDSDDSDDSDNFDIDIDNITNEVKQIESEINSDNISLDSDLSEDSENESVIIEIENSDNSEIMKFVNEVNSFTDNKLKSFKKDELLDFIKKISNNEDSTLKKKNKSDLIINLKNEIKKFI